VVESGIEVRGAYILTANKKKPLAAGIHSRKNVDRLAFPRQEPFKTLPELSTDPKQDLSPNLHLAPFHGGKMILADANAFGKLALRHIKSTHHPDTSTHDNPVNVDMFASCFFP
jgi:hypothetical protein